ncbi:MAG: methyltransferase domain-containing protein [Candidatus Tenebribacter burtonii]|nr:methyltransferase domain-containing protein [Candidatus Tenebribacter burtonii]
MLSKLKKMIPSSVKKILRPIHNILTNKYSSEFEYWKSRNINDNGKFKNFFYKDIMLAMAQESDDKFINDKIVADFGCGPRGSLVWANSAKLRIGIDVLVDRYSNAFKQDITSHNMLYIKSTELCIPIPDNYIDIIFSLNAMDHVDNFSVMSAEILRILKLGGVLYCSFNLGEQKSSTEPQNLSESIIKNYLLNKMKIHEYRITNKGPKNNIYKPFYDNVLNYNSNSEGLLWVKATKL